MLNEKGLEQVRPLSGGIDTWHARRYPLEKCPLPSEAGLKTEVVGTTQVTL